MAEQDGDIRKRSIVIAGHQTSVTLENIFWNELKKIATSDGKSLGQIITDIDQTRTTNLSSAIRVYILKQIRP